MKKIFALILILTGLCFALDPDQATVTFTVQDAGLQAFVNGTYSINLIKPSIPSVGNPISKTNGITIPTGVINGNLSSTGSASVSLWRTDRITPVGWTYAVTVCPAASSHCVTVPNIAITAGSVDISSVINAAIGFISVDSKTVFPKAYQDSEITGASIGDCYYNLTQNVTRCLSNDGVTWASSGGNQVLTLQSLGAVPSAGYYTQALCNNGSAVIQNVWVTQGRVPQVGDSFTVSGCGPAGGPLTCNLSAASGVAGGTVTCGGGVTASTTVTVGSTAVWGVQSDATSYLSTAANNLRQTGGQIVISGGIFGFSGTNQISPGPGQAAQKRTIIDCQGGGQLIWTGADMGTMLKLGDTTNWGSTEVRNCSFFASPNNRVVSVDIGANNGGMVKQYVRNNEFNASNYIGVRLHNTWEDVIENNRFFSCGTVNGQSANFAGIYGPSGANGGNGPINGVIFNNNIFDCYGKYGLFLEANGSGGSFENTFDGNLFEGSTIWTLADIRLNGGGLMFHQGYAELPGNPVSEISYVHFQVDGYGTFYNHFGYCARITSGGNPVLWVVQPSNGGGQCGVDDRLQAIVTRNSGAGTFPAGRDVYIIVTAKDTTRIVETNPTTTATLVVNTVLNDAVNVQTNNYVDTPGTYTQFCVYESDVPTGNPAPARNTYFLAGCANKGTTFTVTANPGTSIRAWPMRPDLYAIDDSSGTVLLGGSYAALRSCTWASAAFNGWQGYYGCSGSAFVPFTQGGDFQIGGIKFYAGDVNANWPWQTLGRAGRVDIAGFAWGEADPATSNSPTYPAGQFGSKQPVPFGAIITNRLFSSTGIHSNLGWRCINASGCANATVPGDWIRWGEQSSRARVDGTSIPVSGTWQTGEYQNNTNPANNPLKGWFNLAGGNPGTWMPDPAVVAIVDLTGQNAAIGTTTLYAVPSGGAGQYELKWDSKATTAAATTSTIGPLTVTYTDPDGVVQTITAAGFFSGGSIVTANGSNSTTSPAFGFPMFINAKASTNIQYSIGYASNPASTMVYNFHIVLSKVN